METKNSIAVIIPCYNEANTIKKVVEDFARVLPEAKIFVFDNGSTDSSGDVARNAGAEVRVIVNKGKGNVVKAMFRDVNADLYVMVDGDGTYPARYAREMVDLALSQEADMVVSNRMTNYQNSHSRKGHFRANRIITQAVNILFDADLKDLLSGYRVLSRRFVKSTPLFSHGFEVEAILSIHALEINAKILEIEIEYRARVSSSQSKLNTYSDSFRIILTILGLFKDRYPIFVYGGVALLFLLSSLLVGFPVILEYFETELAPRFPSAILASGLIILSMLSFVTGIIVKAISTSRREIKKMTFMTTR